MYTLVNIFKESKKSPNAFLGKPTEQEINNLKIGDLVLIGFREGEGQRSVIERKFVRINEIVADAQYKGVLDQNNHDGNPYISNETQLQTVKEGDIVSFKVEHIWRLG